MARACGRSNVPSILIVTLVLCMDMSSAFAATTGTWFDRLYVVIFENTDYSSAITDPNFQKWAQQGKLLTNYAAVAHPSQPNYIAMVAGSTLNVPDDNVYDLSAAPNLVDLLESNTVSWKSYNEDYTGTCNLAATIGSAVCPNLPSSTNLETNLYARKHNPLISMVSVQNNATRCAKIVPGAQLATDKADNTVPELSFYVPNQCNDGHDTGIAYAGTFLDSFMNTTFTGNAISGRTLVIVTFDENDNRTARNQVFTALIPFGTMNVGVNSTDDTPFNHYSILKTVEHNWGLGDLGANDVGAIPFNFP